jgi:hypothetical protein
MCVFRSAMVSPFIAITFQNVQGGSHCILIYVCHTEVTLITTSPELLSSDKSSWVRILLNRCNST